MSSERAGERFRKGYGWTPALDDPDPRVRHVARQALYGKTAGKVKRYGRKRAKSPRLPGARDGDTERFGSVLAHSGDARREWRRRIAQAYGVTFEDIRRAVAIKGRPSRELALLRVRVATALAEIVDREAHLTQRGRGVARQSLMALYGLDEQQLDRLLRAGRAAQKSEGSLANNETDPRDTAGAELDEGDEDAGGLETGEVGDAPAFDPGTGTFE